jgi:hypothetical protein
MGWISVPDPDPDPEGSKTFGRIRSGTEINVSDPDSNPEPKLDSKKYEKEHYFQSEIRLFIWLYVHISNLQVVGAIAVQ